MGVRLPTCGDESTSGSQASSDDIHAARPALQAYLIDRSDYLKFVIDQGGKKK